MKAKEVASVAISFIAFIVSMVAFVMTINWTIEFTETYRFLFSLFMGIFGFASVLAMCFGYIKSFKPFLNRVVAGIESLSGVHDFLRVLLKWFVSLHKRVLIRELNASMKKSFEESTEKEPLFKAYGAFPHLQCRVDPKATSISIELTEDRAIARIPSSDPDIIVKVVGKYIHENLSKTSSVKHIDKLQKSLDLAVLTLILRKIEMNGAFTIAFNKNLAVVFRDAEIRHLYDVLMQLNKELKEKAWLDRTLLRMILMETYNYEMSVRK